MLFTKIILVYREIRTKHKNTLSGKGAEFLSVKPHCIDSNHYALKG
jgi:hypothetical protein